MFYVRGLNNMSRQKGIQDFFKPAGKRSITGNDSDVKRQKINNDENEENIDSFDGKIQEEIVILRENLSVLDPKMGPSWYIVLKPEFSKPYFKTLSDFVQKERSTHTVYPEATNVWSWSKMCPLPAVKVVIIGQDPYHNPGQAHGLCFSVPRGVAPPPSLLNMYKELESDIEGFKRPCHGDLTSWAKQGVLLLNASLTVRQNSPNSHADKGWEKITDAVIKAVSDRNKGVVFLLWGAFAQKKGACVDKKKHHILKAVHPSPLSAMRGFFGCKHFSTCNRLLEQEGKSPISWTLD